MSRIFLRAPDHLGDGVMALPAAELLAGAGELVIAAPGWGRALYAHLRARVAPREAAAAEAARADLAVLLKPSFSAAWQARRAPRRVGEAGDHRRLLLTEVVQPRDRHRADRLLRVAAQALGIDPPGPALPRFPGREALPADLPADMVLLLPGTASAETVAWRGFAELARRLGPRAVATGGPGDEAVLAELGCRVVPPGSLGLLAALAVAATAVVGNDSGLPHLATAAVRDAGQDPAKVTVVTASTDPTRTAAPGSTDWPGPRPACWPCYAKRCSIGAPCRDAPVEPLLSALGAA